MASRCTLLPTLLAVSLFNVVTAHEHHNEVSHEEASAPVDMILWLHILLQALVWGILFPVGMVLGITRSRWHVPLQVRQNSIFHIRADITSRLQGIC